MFSGWGQKDVSFGDFPNFSTFLLFTGNHAILGFLPKWLNRYFLAAILACKPNSISGAFNKNMWNCKNTETILFAKEIISVEDYFSLKVLFSQNINFIENDPQTYKTLGNIWYFRHERKIHFYEKIEFQMEIWILEEM